jgi:serine/threonine protein kinase
MISNKIALLLGGSFYPLHESHIDLLSTARQHYLESGYEVVICLICPSHFNSLSYKFPGITKDFDNRLEIISKFLEKYDWIACYDEIIKKEKYLGFTHELAILRQRYAESGIKLIQIIGTDSKISFAKDNDNVLIVNSGRPISQENMEIIKRVNIINIINMYSPKQTISSTILRFLEKEKYHPVSIKNFDISWLTDCGIILGEGVQGMVRLMLLGNREVAVKICHIASEYDRLLFENECSILSLVEHSSVRISPKLYYYGVIENIGYIVTDVAVPLQKIISIPTQYKNKTYDPCQNTEKEEKITSFLQKICFVKMEMKQTNLIQKYYSILDQLSHDRDLFKVQVIQGLNICLDQLCDSLHIIHRDINHQNILLDIIDGQIVVRIIDYGIAKKIDSIISIRRGPLRFYPMISIDNFNFYPSTGDKYVSTFIIYELLMEHEIYPECKGSTRHIIGKRRNMVFPSWDKQISECFSDVIEKINRIWRDM